MQYFSDDFIKKMATIYYDKAIVDKRIIESISPIEERRNNALCKAFIAEFEEIIYHLTWMANALKIIILLSNDKNMIPHCFNDYLLWNYDHIFYILHSKIDNKYYQFDKNNIQYFVKYINNYEIIIGENFDEYIRDSEYLYIIKEYSAYLETYHDYATNIKHNKSYLTIEKSDMIKALEIELKYNKNISEVK